MTEFSVASMTWAGLKSALKSYYDSVISTLTNKSISLTTNTVTGTTAEFNAALSDGDFATLAGTEVLSGKTTSGLLQQDVSDSTKKLGLDLSTVPTSTTRVIMAPVSRTSQLSLGNSNVETTILSMTAKAAALTAGATFRIRIAGSYRNDNTSGTMTIRVYIGANAAAQTYTIPSQTTSATNKDFYFESEAVIRTSSASGTYIAGNNGLSTVAGWYSGGSTATGTSVVDCTADQTVKVTAQWASALSLNILLIETATIQQLI